MNRERLIDDAWAVLEDCSYLNSDNISEEDYDYYARVMQTIYQALNPLRNKHLRQIAEAIDGEEFACAAYEGLINYISDYGDEEENE